MKMPMPSTTPVPGTIPSRAPPGRAGFRPKDPALDLFLRHLAATRQELSRFPLAPSDAAIVILRRTGACHARP